MAAELVKRWRAADGSEHNSKQAVNEYEARQSLDHLLQADDGRSVTEAAIENALVVIAALRVFAPVKRPRQPKPTAINCGPAQDAAEPVSDDLASVPAPAVDVSDEFAGGYGNQAAGKGKGKGKKAA